MSDPGPRDRSSRRLPAFDAPGETAALARAVDWSATSLSAVEDWPASLRAAVGICLASRFPMLVLWGREMGMVYNDAYLPIVGPDKHPQAFGGRAEDWFGEIWPTVSPMLGSVLDRGVATWSENLPLRLLRHGLREEGAFTFSYSPIHEGDGAVAGIFVAVTETTGHVQAARRLRLLSELSQASSETGVAAVCAHVAEVLASDAADIRFAAVYLGDGDGDGERLIAAGGIEPGSSLAPREIEQGALPWPVRGAVEGIPGALAIEAEAQDCSQGLVFALGDDRAPTRGHLVVGLSPYQRLEGDYRAFLVTVAHRLTAMLSAASSITYVRTLSGRNWGARIRTGISKQLQRLASFH